MWIACTCVFPCWISAWLSMCLLLIAISFALSITAKTTGELRALWNKLFFASLLDAWRRKPVSLLIQPFSSWEAITFIGSLLSVGAEVFSTTINSQGSLLLNCWIPKNQDFSGISFIEWDLLVDKRKDEDESSSAKLGFEVIMLNQANVLAGHLQTHLHIVAKTAIWELSSVDSGMI